MCLLTTDYRLSTILFMTNTILQKYAHLLVNYSLDVQPGDKVLIRSSTLAEPLIREVYRETLRAGGHPETMIEFEGQERILLEEGNEFQLTKDPQFLHIAMAEYDCYLRIRAPYNLREMQNVSAEKASLLKAGRAAAMRIYTQRTATRALKRSLCQYPTMANAQEAGMSLEAYEKFVYGACFLYDENPEKRWLEVREYQQAIVDVLNRHENIRYKNDKFDISFSTKGRTWINSDGQTNMPSGEVYTSPVEDSVNGMIYFSLPAFHGGHEVNDATLWVKDGEIYKWDAKKGKNYLDYVFSLEGARRFGEAAIGTNRNIQRITKNILFDEKIGGTIHMAIGQSYAQAGGKNQSSIHWDLITDMKNGGEIYADGKVIYRNGDFLFL